MEVEEGPGEEDRHASGAGGEDRQQEEAQQAGCHLGLERS